MKRGKYKYEVECDDDHRYRDRHSRGRPGHWAQGGPPPWANFDYASALNEFLMLGNVATQFDETLEFDPIAMKITNNSQADSLLRCECRRGWIL